jgi:hypothetical protein
MTCKEFQSKLPYIIDTGGDAEHEEHLKSCAVCADLVADLRYIAEQAKLLVPMEDPNPRVWDGIQRSLEREGLVKSAPARRSLLETQRAGWGWFTTMGALFLIAIGLLMYRHGSKTSSAEVTLEMTAADSSLADDSDRQVLAALEQKSPHLKHSFEQNLRSVNAYIADVQQSVHDNPDDSEARSHLLRAYEQKAMLYEMAQRSSE